MLTVAACKTFGMFFVSVATMARLAVMACLKLAGEARLAVVVRLVVRIFPIWRCRLVVADIEACKTLPVFLTMPAVIAIVVATMATAVVFALVREAVTATVVAVIVREYPTLGVVDAVTATVVAVIATGVFAIC